MGYPEAIALASVVGMVCFIARLISKGHRHKWKETDRAPLLMEGKRIGEVSYCVCEECGEPRRFDLE